MRGRREPASLPSFATVAGRRSALPALVLAAIAAVFAAACAGPGQNVRAYRAYAHEEASMRVTIDRVEDVARALELVDRILSGTSYTPNDLWPRRLALSDAEARGIKDELRGEKPYDEGGFEVPIVKVFRVHLERTFREYGPPPEAAMYPSLLDAVAALGPRSVALRDHWRAYRDATEELGTVSEDAERLRDEIAALRDEGQRRAREPEFQAARLKVDRARRAAQTSRDAFDRDVELLRTDARLDTPTKQQIARDAFAALSVSLRLEMEVAAFLPVVAIQAVRALPGAPRDLTVRPTMKLVKQAWHLPVYLFGLRERIERQIAAIEFATQVLAGALGTSVKESPGWALGESIVDQIVGITIDSFRLDAKAGGELFVYNSVPTPQRTTSDDGKVSFDYSGRKYKLEHVVEPIVLTRASFGVSLDWIRMPNVASLGFGYATDRVFRRGGSVENTSLVKQLGIEGPQSDVIEAALGLLGVRTSVRTARFTSGKVRQVLAQDVRTEVASAPLQLTLTQVDVGYDILWAVDAPGLKAFTEELVVGGRYLRYTLPRIAYELRDVSTEAGKTQYAMFPLGRESPPQPVTTIEYLGGATARFGLGEAPRWSPFLDLGFYGGAGPVQYYQLRGACTSCPEVPDVPENRQDQSGIAWALNGQAGLGLRWRLLPRGSRVRLDLRAVYAGNAIWSTLRRSGTSGGRATATDFGAIDVFHGPAIALRGAL